ncbi:MAG: NYN domain-containing protein [Microvirga sp.]
MTTPQRIALFIDGANLYATTKTLGFDIDYKRLLKEFQSRGTLVRAFYYTALVEDQEYSSIRPLIDWLDYNGYRVVTKPTKEFVDSAGRRKVKGNMDIELAIDALELAPYIDHMVLFSGDGDFRSLVEAMQRRGVRVSVASTVTTQPPMVADELRRQADEFLDLSQMAARIGRDPVDRPPRNVGEPGEIRGERPRYQGPNAPPAGPGLERRYGIRQASGGEVDE